MLSCWIPECLRLDLDRVWDEQGLRPHESPEPAVIGKLTGFAGVAGAISAKGLPLAPVLLLQNQRSRA